MRITLIVFRRNIPALFLLFALTSGISWGLGQASFQPPEVTKPAWLANPVEIAVVGMDIDAVALLPDSETVVVVGGKSPPNPPDPNWIVSAAPPAGAIINLKTKAVHPFTNGHLVRIKSATCSADGARIYTLGASPDSDPLIRVWDVKASKSLEPLPKFGDAGVNDIACFHKSRKLAVALYNTIILVDPAKPEKQEYLTGGLVSDRSYSHLVISPDDRFVACTTLDDDVVIWDLTNKNIDDGPVYKVNLLPLGADRREWSIHALAFTKDSKQLLAARSITFKLPKGMPVAKVAPEDRKVALIDIDKRQVSLLEMGHQVRTFSVAVHPSGKWVVTEGLGWQAPRPFKPDQKEAAKQVRELHIYDFPKRALIHRVQQEFLPGWIRFTPNGKKLIAVSHNKLRAWDLESPQTK